MDNDTNHTNHTNHTWVTLKWVTNSSGNAVRAIGETQAEADAALRLFESKLTKGKPEATAAYTVEELEQMGVYGLYKELSGTAEDSVQGQRGLTP